MDRTKRLSVAAPVGSHDAVHPRTTNGKAPVTPRQGAAIERMRATRPEPGPWPADPGPTHSGAAASGAGIAGMAGPAGPARPEQLPNTSTITEAHAPSSGLRSTARMRARCRALLAAPRYSIGGTARVVSSFCGDSHVAKPKMQFDEIGEWSEIKLEIIKKYTRAYSTILTKKSFTHYYIDGFAGAGVHISKTTGDWVPGSPLNALLASPPFKHHFLIDLDGSRVQGLKEIIGKRSDVTLFQGDCNAILLNNVFPRVRYERYERALCLLDPYGLQLDWKVLEAAGRSRTIDLFLNFPIMDMNRRTLWTDPDRVSAEQAGPMTAFWGDDSWKSVAYRPSSQSNLFGDLEVEKVPNDAIVEAFQERLRLKAGFKYVAQPVPMRNSTNAVVYYLFFATQQAVAINIIEEIFKKYRGTK